MLSQINPIHDVQKIFCKIYFSIILLCMHMYSKWPLSLRFLHQTLYASLLSSIHATCPNHLILFKFDIPNNTAVRQLTTGILSKKCVVWRFRRCANVIECTYTNLDTIAYYTARLYDIAYCS